MTSKGTIEKLQKQFSNPYVDIIFVCKICRKEQKSNWQRHYNTHSDDRPHTCQYCGKGYKRADVLSLHIKKTHQDTTTNVKMEEQQQQQQLQSVQMNPRFELEPSLYGSYG